MTPPPPRIELCVPRTTQYLSMVRKVVAMAAQRVGFDQEAVDVIELAVDEACSNAVLYKTEDSPLELRVEVEITDERFSVILRDGGPRYPFEEKGNFSLDDQLQTEEDGGLGIYIIKKFMDEVAYEFSDELGSVIRMTKLREVVATSSPG